MLKSISISPSSIRTKPAQLCDCLNCKKIGNILLERGATANQIDTYTRINIDEPAVNGRHHLQSWRLLRKVSEDAENIASNIKRYFSPQ